MKHYIFLLAMIAMTGLYSCQKEVSSEDNPGNGDGDNPAASHLLAKMVATNQGTSFVRTDTFQWDGKGNLLKIVQTTTDPFAYDSIVNLFTHLPNGAVSTFTTSSFYSSGFSGSSVTKFHYNSDNSKLMYEIGESYTSASTSPVYLDSSRLYYGTNGKLDSLIRYSLDLSSGVYVKQAKVVYGFDAAGNLVTYQVYAFSLPDVYTLNRPYTFVYNTHKCALALPLDWNVDTFVEYSIGYFNDLTSISDPDTPIVYTNQTYNSDDRPVAATRTDNYGTNEIRYFYN